MVTPCASSGLARHGGIFPVMIQVGEMSCRSGDDGIRRRAQTAVEHHADRASGLEPRQAAREHGIIREHGADTHHDRV